MAWKGNRKRAAVFLRSGLAGVLAALAVSLGACSGSSRPAASTTSSEAAVPGGASPGGPGAGGSARSAAGTPSPAPEASDAMATAASLLQVGRYEEAVTAYHAVAVRVADGETAAAALLGEAVARYASGDAAGAIPLLRSAAERAPAGSLTHRRAAYLLGLRLNEAGQFGSAAMVLEAEAAREVDDPLRPYILVARAEALSGAADPAAAAAWSAVAALTLPDPLTETMYRERATLARTAGDDRELARWLALLVDRAGAPGDRLELAKVATRLGDSATASAQLLAIVSRSPASAQAGAALQLLDAAGVAVDPGQRGLVLYRRGDYGRAIAVLEPAAAVAGIPDAVRGFRLYYLAASYEDAGRVAEAVRTYDAAAAVAGAPYAHRARYWAARVTEGAGDVRSASARYLELAAAGPPGEFSAEAAFRAGFTLLKAGDASGALGAWARLGTTGDARLLYWRARASSALGDSAAARSSFEAAFAADPLGFYGVEAGRAIGKVAALSVAYQKRNLQQAVDWDAIATWLGTRIAGASPGSRPTAAADLMALGLREQAAAAIAAEEEGAGAWRLVELGREASRLGLDDVVARIALDIRAQAAVSWDSAPKDLLRAAYPVGFPQEVESQARTFGVDPLFLAALVRQESFWDPAAGSYAGALGLTQVIPPTGESIASALGVDNFHPSDLFRPSVSLRFGASYISGQLAKYGPYLALGAYNAGPGAAARWQAGLGESATGPDIVEAIDIGETSSYVEQIISHYAHYLAAYAP